MNAFTQSPLIEPSRELRDTCAIVGTATSRLGKVPGTSSLDLMVEAIRNALDDAGLKASDVDGVLCRGPDDSYSHHQLVAERLGVNARFSTTLTNGGASQIMSVALAVRVTGEVLDGWPTAVAVAVTGTAVPLGVTPLG
jgi:3-oxoacyl-[acyl-carrier-protein] synthase III